jgi:hypothetical protein
VCVSVCMYSETTIRTGFLRGEPFGVLCLCSELILSALLRHSECFGIAIWVGSGCF